MIDKSVLSRVSRIKGLTNLDFASKDYFQEIMLLSISREMPHLVFKGGTCLYKFHGLDRFSEDIGLVGKVSERDLPKISEYLSDFGYPSGLKTYTMRTGVLSTFSIKGFLYNGEDVSLTRVKVDVTEKDKVILPAVQMQLRSLYPDMPSFFQSTMDPDEIFAEKFRSLFQRSRSRDLYDLGFLVKKDIRPDPELILAKMRAYDLELDHGSLTGSLERIETSWPKEMRPILSWIPPFEDYKKIALGIFSELNGHQR